MTNPALLIPERRLQENVKEMAEALGYLTYHSWLSIKSVAGYPDLTLVHKLQRRVIWVELKAEGKNPTARQEHWLSTLRQAGQESYCWQPHDWLDGTIETILRGAPTP